MARQRSSGSRSYSKPSTTAARTSTTDTAPSVSRSSARGTTGSRGATATRPRSGPRRDWSKIALYTFSVIIVLSMVLSLFAPFLR